MYILRSSFGKGKYNFDCSDETKVFHCPSSCLILTDNNIYFKSFVSKNLSELNLQSFPFSLLSNMAFSNSYTPLKLQFPLWVPADEEPAVEPLLEDWIKKFLVFISIIDHVYVFID
jgi:hypothetical protein